MPVLKKRSAPLNQHMNGLYVHFSPPRVLNLSPADIKQLIKLGDVHKLEQVVLEGQGRKLIGEYSPDYKVRNFLKTVPALTSKIALLHDAVNSNKLPELQAILNEEDVERQKKLVMAKDETGVGLLHKAVYHDLKDVYKYLVENYPQIVNLKDADGRTAYHYSAMCRDAKGVQKLLSDAGADHTVVDNRQHSAKYYMEHKQDLELPNSNKVTSSTWRSPTHTNGLVIKKSNIRIWIHQRNLSNLQQVVWEGHGSQLLVEHSNSPKIRKFLEGVPHIMGLVKDIHCDVQNNELDSLKSHTSPPVLPVVLSGKDSNGLTPLHKAAGLGRQGIAEYIVEKYPDSVNAVDSTGRTPLHYAALLKEDEGKMWDFLIKSGADESILDEKQKTAAYYKTRTSEIDNKLLQVVPECPRTAKDTFVANWDWNLLLASTPTEEIVKTVKKSEMFFGNAAEKGKAAVEKLKDEVDNKKEEAEKKVRDFVNNTEENNNDNDKKNNSKQVKKNGSPRKRNISPRKEEEILQSLNKLNKSNAESETGEIIEENANKSRSNSKMEEQRNNSPTKNSTRRASEMHDEDKSSPAKTKSRPDSQMQNNGNESSIKNTKSRPDSQMDSSPTKTNKSRPESRMQSTDNESPTRTSKSRPDSQMATNGNSSPTKTSKSRPDSQMENNSPTKTIKSRPESQMETSPTKTSKSRPDSQMEGNGTFPTKTTKSRPDSQMEGNVNNSPTRNIKSRSESQMQNGSPAKNHKSRPASRAQEDFRPNTKSPNKQYENGKEELMGNEGVIEGIVNGENEVETLNEQGQDTTVDNGPDDEEIAAMVESGNMEQLAAVVLNGDGDKLVGQHSDNPELQTFLDNVPVYMSKINRIHVAAKEGNLRDLQAALDRRKFAIAKDKISPNGASPLHVATVFGNTSIVRYLAGRFPETLQAADDEGRTPLHYAAVLADNGHYYNLLLHLGADTRVEDKAGHTPDYYKTNRNTLSHAKLLRDLGADEQQVDEILSDKVPDDTSSARKDLDDEDMLKVLERCYNVLHGRRASNAISAASIASSIGGQQSLLGKHLKRFIFDVIKLRVTKLDHNLYDLIWPSVKKLPQEQNFKAALEQDFPTGVVIPDFYAYVVFAEFLVPLIKDINCIDLHTDLHEQPPMKFDEIAKEDDVKVSKADFDLDPHAKNVISEAAGHANSQVDMPFFRTEEGRYLASSLGDPLIKGLTEVANKRPEDPIAYLATYLYNFASSSSKPRSSKSRGKTQENQQQVVQGSPEQSQNNQSVPETIEVVTVEPDGTPVEENSAFSNTSRDEHGQSMLHFAAARSHGRNALFQLLMETEINLGYRDELYRSARDISIQASLPENTLEIDKYVMQIATKGEIDKLVELLLEGYDHIIDIVDEDEAPIVDAVSKADQPDTVAFLQSILAFEEKRERVHHAIRQNNLVEVKNLLADKNDTGSGKLLAIGKNSYGRCTLHIAVLCQQEEIVDYLANTFPETLIVGDNLERTVLHYAMGVEKMETISRVLIKAGAKRVVKDLKGRQPTYYFMNKSDILRLQEEEETF